MKQNKIKKKNTAWRYVKEVRAHCFFPGNISNLGGKGLKIELWIGNLIHEEIRIYRNYHIFKELNFLYGSNR